MGEFNSSYREADVHLMITGPEDGRVHSAWRQAQWLGYDIGSSCVRRGEAQGT